MSAAFNRREPKVIRPGQNRWFAASLALALVAAPLDSTRTLASAHSDSQGSAAASDRAEIQNTSAANPAASPNSEEGGSLRVWDEKWRELQSAPEAVSLGDHWRVCDLKFRFRNYRDLFRCLELIEQRVQLDENIPQRKYTPVLVGWMRGSAYAELGELDEAIKWSESAWQKVPLAYRNVSDEAFECHDSWGVPGAGFCKDDYSAVVVEAGGSKWGGPQKVGDLGRNNPAGLDMRPQMIVMSLAAQRSLLHLERREPELANLALRDLYKWRDASIGMTHVFAATANRLAMGPLFGLGDYAAVIKAHDSYAGWLRRERVVREVIGNVMSLGGVSARIRKSSIADSRRFATALEDASSQYLYAASLVRLGQTERAEKAFDEMLNAPETRDMGSLYWAVLYERSQVAHKRAQRADEIRYLHQAVDAIERVRESVTFESGKIGFAASKQTVYAALVSALAELGDWTGAYEVVERAKARALVDLLAHVHELAPPPAAGDKARQLLASASVNDAQIGFPVNDETVQMRNLVETARTELPQVAPEAASLVSVQTASLADIAAKLAPNETLINYFQANEDLYAFVQNGTQVKGFRLEGKGLNEAIRAFRAAIETTDAAEADAGRALYERLIRPLASELARPKLTISPHGVLHYLPFAALRDGDQFLIDRYSLRVIPSASALAYLRTDTPAKVGKVLALGNPDLGDPKYDLPNAQLEALQVAQLFPDSRALVRQQASKTAVRELGSSFAMLHFATHARFDPDSPLSSGLYLASSNEADDDGRLTVSDLYAMRLDVQLVTLSACQTGLGQVLSGDDVIGLTRGFLYAGARSIVASLWSVDDAATAQLMVLFYQNLSSHGAREALRLAQIGTRQQHPSPRLWAAFEITGNAD